MDDEVGNKRRSGEAKGKWKERRYGRGSEQLSISEKEGELR